MQSLGTLRVGAMSGPPRQCCHQRSQAAASGPRTRRQAVLRVCSVATQLPPGLRVPDWTGNSTQVKALEELRQRMSASPYSEQAHESLMRWFLLDRKLVVDEAEEKLVKMLRWRREFGADSIQLTDVAKEVATGKAFLHAHPDVTGRPVIVVRAARHLTGASPLIDSQRLCVHLLDRAMEALPEDDPTVLGIFDLRGFSSKNADLGFVRFLVDIFFTYYPKRLSQVLFVDAPWVFKPGWEMVKPWLKKYAALVRFVSAEEARREYFTPQTVPEDFAEPPFPRGSRK